VTEIAERVGSSVEQVLEAIQAAGARHASSLDQPHREGDDPASRAIEVAVEEPGFAAAEDAALLDSVMRELTERERPVLNLRFREDLTQSQIAAMSASRGCTCRG
jgi:RNA polymerase sigma-B factor